MIQRYLIDYDNEDIEKADLGNYVIFADHLADKAGAVLAERKRMLNTLIKIKNNIYEPTLSKIIDEEISKIKEEVK